MERTEDAKSNAGAPSALNVGLGHYPPERTHGKTEIWWLIEADSPCIFMSPQNYTTTIAWDAYRFLSHRGAEAFLESQLEFWDGYVGKKDWKIVDHIFYV